MDTEADSVESIANETVLAFAHPDEFGRPDVLTSFTTIKAVFGMPSRANDPTAAILIPPQEANALARRVASVRASLALWKSKDKVKLMQVGLVLCLNVGIDQPAPGDPDFAGAMMDYRSVMSRTECWIDTGITAPGVSAKSIEGAVMRALTTAYTRLMPKQGIVKAVRDNAPTVDHIRKLFNNLRKVALGNCDRVLMHYNGHGMPRPTPAGELWALSTDQTEYVPIHARELKAWVGSPAMYVLDCSNAGVLMPYLIAPLPGTAGANGGATPSELKGGAGTRAAAVGDADQLEPFIMAACSKGESLPLQTGLPADVFTCCLTCPLKISLLWSLQTGQAAVVLPRAFRALIGRLPGKLSDRKSPLGELNWLLVAVTDTIAWTRLPRALFLRLFRQDFMVATLFRNYLLADRIMRFCGCVPLCNPPLPSTHDHPLWAQWDSAVLSVISQLPSMLGYTAFDMQRLDAIGTGLGSGLIRPNDVVAQAQAWGSDALNENPVSEQAPSAAPPPTAPTTAGSSASQAGAVVAGGGGPEGGGGNAVEMPKDKLLRRAASGGIPAAGSASDAGAVTALPVMSAPGLPAQSKQWAVIYHALEGGGQDPLALSLPPAASATARQRVRFLRHRLRHVQPTVISGLAPPPPPPVARSFGLGGLNPLIHLARPGRVGNVPLAGEFMAVEEDPRDPKATGGSNYSYSYINTTFFTDALEGFEVWLRAASWVASRESARVADVLVDCMTASSGGPLALPPSNSASKVASAGELPSLARDSTPALSPPSSPTVLAAQRAGDLDVTGTEDDEGVKAQAFTLGDAARIAHRTLRTQPPLLLPIQSSSGLGLGLNPGPLKGRDAVPSFPVASRPAFHGGHPIPVVVTPRIRAPDQLPVLLQMVLSGQRRRAVELFARFLDLGPEAVNLALLVGLHNYVMKLLASAADNMKEREKERNESPLAGKDGAAHSTPAASPHASSAPPPTSSAPSSSMLPLGAYTGATVLILAKMLAVECTKSTALELVHKYSCISFLCAYMHAQAESRQRQLLARSGSADPSAASGPGQGAGAQVAGGSSSPTGAGAAAAAAALEAEVEVRDPTLSITSDQTGAALFVLCKLLGTYPESCGDSCVRAHVLGVVSLLLNALHPVAGNVQWALLCLSRLLLHDPAVAPGAPSGIPSVAQAILAGKVARLAPQRSSPAASPALHAANKQPLPSTGSDQAAPPAPAGSKDVVSCSMLDSEYHRALPHLSALTVDTIVRCLAEPEPAVRAAAAVACSQLFVFSSKTDAAPRLGASSSELGKEGGAALAQTGGLLQHVLVNAAQYAVCRMALLHGAQDAVSAVTAVAVGVDKRRDGSQPRLASVRTEMSADGFHSAGSLKSTGSDGKGEDRMQTKVVVNPTLQAVGGSVSLPNMATLAAAELYVPVPAIRSFFSSTRMAAAAQPRRPSKRGSAGGKLASGGDGQRSGASRMQVTIAPYTEGALRVDVSDADAQSQTASGMQYARAAWYIAYCVVGSGGSGAFPLPLAGARNTVETHSLTKSVKQAAAARTERRRWVLLALARRMKKLMVPSAAIVEVPQHVIDGYHATVVQAHAAAAAAAASAMYMRQQAAAAVMAMPGGEMAQPMADGSRGMQHMASGGAPVGLDSSGDGTGWQLDAADGVPLHEGGRVPSSAPGSREGSRGAVRRGEVGLGMLATGDPYDGQGAGSSMIDASYTGGSAGALQHPSLDRRASDSELVALPNPLPLSATLPQLSIRASAQGGRPQPVSTSLPGPANSATLSSVAGSTTRLVSMTDVQGGRASPMHKAQSQGSLRLHGQGGSFVGSPLASNSNKGPLMSEGSSSSLGALSVKNALVGAVNAGRGGAAELDTFAQGDKDTGPPPPGLFAQLLAGAATHSTPASAVPGPRGSKSMPGTQSSAPSPVVIHDAPSSNFLGSALTAQARSPFGATTGTSSSGPNSGMGSMVLEGGSTGPRPAGGLTKNMSNTNLGALHPWAATGHAVTGSRGSAGLMPAGSRQLQQGAVAPPPVPGLVGTSAAQAADRAKVGRYTQSTPDFGSSASGVSGATGRQSAEPNPPAMKRLRPERAAEHVLGHCETLDREFATLASGMPQHVRTACMGACALPALSDASAAVRSEALALLACMLDSDPCHEAALCTVATLSLIDHLTGGPFLLTALGLTMSGGGSAQQSGSGYASGSAGGEVPGTPAARRGRGPPTAPSPVDGPGGQANAGAGIAARAAAGRGTPAYNAGDGGASTPKPKAGLLKRVVAAVTGQKLRGQGPAGGVPRTPGTGVGDDWSGARESSADQSPVASELFPPSDSSDHDSSIGRTSMSALRKTRSPLFGPAAAAAGGNGNTSSSDANAHMVIARDIRSLGLGLPEDILTLGSLYSCLEYTTAAYEHTHLAESGVTAQLAANAGTGSVHDILESAMASLGKPSDGRGGAREFFSPANTKAWAWLLSPSAGVGETPTAASLWVRTVSTTAVSNLGLPGVLYTAIWLCILSATSDPEPLVAAFAARLVRRTLYHVVEAAGLASVSSLPVQESTSAARPGRRSSAGPGDVRAAVGVAGRIESVDEPKEKGRGSATSTATDATVEQDVPAPLTAEDKASIRVRYVAACASHWSTSFRPPSLAPDKQLALALKPGAMLQAFAKGPGLDLSFLTAAGGITSPNTGSSVVNGGGGEGEPVWPGLLAGCDPSGSVHYEYACTRWYRPQLRPVSRSEDEDPISSSSLRNAARQRLTLAGLTEGTLLAATAYDDTLLRALSEASARVWDELQDHARFTRFTGLQTLLETRLGVTNKSQGGQAAMQSRPGARSRAGSIMQGPLPRRRARVRSREGPLSGSMDATELVLQSLVTVDSSLQSFLRVLQSDRPSPVPGHPTGTRIFRLPDGTIRLLPPEVPLFSPVYLPPMYGLGYGVGMGLDGAPLAYPAGGQAGDGSLPFQSPAFYPMAFPFYDPMRAGMPWMMESGAGPVGGYGPMALSMGTAAFGAGLGMGVSMGQSPWVGAVGMGTPPWLGMGMDHGGADGNNPSAMQTPYVGSMGMGAGAVGSLPGDASLGSPATAHLPGASVGAAYPGFWSSHGPQAASAMDPSAGMMYHGGRQGAGLPTPMLMGLQGVDAHGGVGSMPNTAHAMLLRADSSQGFLRGGSTPSFGPGGPSSTSVPGLRLGAGSGQLGGSGQMGSGQLANLSSATTSTGNLQWPAGQQAARTYGQVQGTPVYGSLGNVGLPLSPALGAVGGGAGMAMGELRLEGEQQARRATNPALARVQGTATGPEPSPPSSALHTVPSAGNFNLGPSAAEAVGGGGLGSSVGADGAKVAAISSGPHGDRSDHSRTLSAGNGVTLMPAPSSFALDTQQAGAPMPMEGGQGGGGADGGQGTLLPATVALGGEPADVLTDTAVEALARGLASTTPRLPLPLLARIPAAAVRLARESAKRMRQRATIDVSPHATSTACLLFHPTEELLFAVGGGSDVITRWDTRDGSPAGMFHASTGVSLHSSSAGGGVGMEVPAHATPGLHTGALGSIGVHAVPVWSRAYTGSIRGRLRSLQANSKWHSGLGGSGAAGAGMGPTVPASPARSKEPSSAALPPASARKVDPSASLRRADSMARKPLPFGMGPSSTSSAAPAPLPGHGEEGPMAGSGVEGDESGAYASAVHTGVVARKVAPVITAALWLDEHAGCHLATGTSDGVVRVWDGQDVAGGRWDVEAADVEENQRSRGHAKTVGRSSGATVGAGSSRSGDHHPGGYPPTYAQGAGGGTWGEYVGMAQAAATGPAMISSFNAMPELRSWVYSASKASSWMGAGAMSFAGAGVASMGGSDQAAGAGAGGAGLLMHWLPGYGKLVVGGGTQGYVRIWDLHTQRCAYTVPAAVGPGQAITSICGQWPGTQLLVLGTSTGAIHVVDTRLASDAASTAGAVTSALAHGGAGPSARAAVISSAAYKRSTVGLSRSAVVSVLAEHPKYVTAVAQARSGQAYSVVSASIAGDIRFWDLRQRNSVECVRKDPGITALALHDYAPLLAVGNGARQHVDIMTNTGMSLGHMAYHEGFLGQRLGPVTSLAWHPHRLLLSVGTMDSIVGLYHGSPIIEKDR